MYNNRTARLLPVMGNS